MSNSVQHKLINHEVTPPAELWDKIAAALDESELVHKFPSKLYDIESTPPLAAWNKIALSLDEEQKAFVPQRRRVSPILRYAAAAAITGLIAWGGIKIFSGRKTEPEIARVTAPVKDSAILTITGNSAVTNDSNNLADEARDNAALEASKQTFASLDIPANNRIKQRIHPGFSEPLALSGLAGELTPEETYQELTCTEITQPSVTDNDKKENLASRYIMLITPDGNIIRMSKKWSHLLCCVSGEEQDADCKNQLKKWREKVAGSSIAPSPGNFMDILSLVNSLQENNH